MRRLSEIERERRTEQLEAKRWLRKNERHLDPSVTDTSRVREQTMQNGERVERLIRLGMWAEGEDDQVVYDEGARFVPLISTPQEFDLKRAEVAARVRHVLQFMDEGQRDLLWAYYVEGVSWQDLRRKHESRQAVHERLAWARNSFHKAWLAHALDEVNIKEADL